MRKSLWLILLLLSFRTAAQVSMTPQLPPAGVILKAQLWNMVLVSASDAPVNVRITLHLKDLGTNQPLLTGITKQLTLHKGARQLQAGDVVPVQYEYLSAVTDRSENGLLSPGKYLACYSLWIVGDKTDIQPAEECIPFVIEPVSPPLLNMPANHSVLETKLPQFSWIPPAPITMFSDLNYEMILTEVHNGQAPEEAIQQNIAVYRAPRLRTIFATYPSAAVALDTARTYAWSVIARNGPHFAAQTETWTFRIAGPAKLLNSTGGAYAALKKELDGSLLSFTDELRLSYRNETGDSSVAYEVLALEDNNNIVYTGTLALQPGSNQLDVAVNKRKLLHDGKTYLFRLRNTREEYWQLKFMYSKDKK
jgi:hypothetical protein